MSSNVGGEVTDAAEVLNGIERITTWLSLAGVLGSGLIALAREIIRGSLLPKLRPEVSLGLLKTLNGLVLSLVVLTVISIAAAFLAPVVAPWFPGARVAVAGVVRDRAGGVVPDADVSVIGGTARTTTTASGRFKLSTLRSRQPLRLAVSKPGFIPWDDYANDPSIENIIILTPTASSVDARREPSIESSPSRPNIRTGAVAGKRPGGDVETVHNPAAELHTVAPTERLIREVLQGFEFEVGSAASLDEARRMLDRLQVVKYSISNPSYISGSLSSGYEVTIWPRTYDQPGCYGIRFGQPLPGRPYFGTNATYFQICK